MSVRSLVRVMRTAYRCQMQEFVLRPHYFYVMVGQPVFFMALSVFLFRHVGREDLVPGSVIGAGIIGIWNANLFSSGMIVERERRDGTLLFLVASPTDAIWVLLGRSLANSTVSACSVLIALLLAASIAPETMPVADYTLLLVSLLMTVGAVTALGLVAGCAFVWFRQALRVVGLMNWPAYIISGVMFPVSYLPGAFRAISYTLAPTWGLVGLRASFGLAGDTNRARIAASLGILTCAYVCLAYYSYRLVIDKIRAEGRLAEW
ncbi:MAG: ABC transporter permease [Bacteroidota bacterium]